MIALEQGEIYQSHDKRGNKHQKKGMGTNAVPDGHRRQASAAAPARSIAFLAAGAPDRN